MAFPAPAKSQPLHNFDLPQLTWNKDGQSGVNKRRRSIKSPLRRPNASSSASPVTQSQQPNASSSASPVTQSQRPNASSSASPITQPQLRDSVSSTPPPPRLHSPLGESVVMASRGSAVRGDYPVKQSPLRGGEPFKPPINGEGLKNSPPVGGGDSERVSLLREESLRPFQRGDSSSESDALRRGKSGLIEYRRNHYRNSAISSSKNGANSSHSKQAEEKLEKKSMTADAFAVVKNVVNSSNLKQAEEKVEKKSKATEAAFAVVKNAVNSSNSKQAEEKHERKSKATDAAFAVVKNEANSSNSKQAEEKHEKKSKATEAALAVVKNAVSSLNSKQAEEKIEKKSKAAEVDAAAAGIKKSKILIRLPSKNKQEEGKSEEGLLKFGINGEHGEGEKVQDEGKIDNFSDGETKIWDLRPRKPKLKLQRAAVGGERSNVQWLAEKKKALSLSKNANKSGAKEGKSGGSGGEKQEKIEKEKDEKKLKNIEREKGEKKLKIVDNEKGEKNLKIEKEKGEKKLKIEKEKGEKKEKTKKEKGEKQEKNEEDGEKQKKKKLSISISLTKEEIEADIFAMTGSKPSKRPKKRAKNVQKHLDYTFPGLWLVSITSDSYKVSESFMKV